ncbi:HD domain-containing protein [Fodinisporobacter ferrooxydans]|uniref:HD domain-containing protein n=1 Tax=Fodinisporobacter ferrooxydans TaxID=2901836 RepID=A0ABY4CLZ2_9BACL|nr:HD domain-containing protein [Alicyclobacillaceae bacterium MYW30-H2]
MSGSFMEEKVFKDPVHDYLYVKDRFIWDLINTKAMQRLRFIKQLGTSYLTFHGAEHSRFAHSLGTYDTMRQVISHFKRNHGWNPDERLEKLALSAALLHDIGHGPFSHTFERCFRCHHESWTARILLEDAELQQIFSQMDDAFAFDVVRVLRKESEYPILHQLISSQLDVDRMDYLLRDATATGVIYGKFELERLIRVMRPAENMVVVKASGIHTVEQYLLARYFMYSQVYQHKVTIGADVLIEKILQRATDCYQNQVLSYIPAELVWLFADQVAEMPVDEYMQLDDVMLLSIVRRWAKEEDPILRDLSDRLLTRRLFKSISYKNISHEQMCEFMESFQKLGIDPASYLEFRQTTTDGYLYRQGIYCCDENNHCQDIAEISPVIRSLTPRTENRMYYPKDLLVERSEGEKLLTRILKLEA